MKFWDNWNKKRNKKNLEIIEEDIQKQIKKLRGTFKEDIDKLTSKEDYLEFLTKLRCSYSTYAIVGDYKIVQNCLEIIKEMYTYTRDKANELGADISKYPETLEELVN